MSADSSAAYLPEVEDYRDRLERARRELMDRALGAVGDYERARLTGKVSGVELALDYLRGYPALTAPSEEGMTETCPRCRGIGSLFVHRCATGERCEWEWCPCSPSYNAPSEVSHGS